MTRSFDIAQPITDSRVPQVDFCFYTIAVEDRTEIFYKVPPFTAQAGRMAYHYGTDVVGYLKQAQNFDVLVVRCPKPLHTKFNTVITLEKKNVCKQMCGLIIWANLFIFQKLIQKYNLRTSPHQHHSETYLLDRNAGHMVPLSQPPWAQQMLEDFTSGRI